MGLESRESCQELSEVQRPDAYAVILAVICEAQEKGLKRRQRRRFGVSTDVRNRGTQAF